MIDRLVEDFGLDREELTDFFNKRETFVVTRGEDVAVFQKIAGGIVEGHYAFKSRGKEALDVARDILDEVFASGVSVVMGKTPHYNKKARWFSRQLGFKSIMDIDTPKGLAEVFVLKKGDK